MKHFYILQKEHKITEVQALENNKDGMFEAPQRAVMNILNFSKSYRPIRIGNKRTGLVLN